MKMGFAYHTLVIEATEAERQEGGQRLSSTARIKVIVDDVVFAPVFNSTYSDSKGNSLGLNFDSVLYNSSMSRFELNPGRHDFILNRGNRNALLTVRAAHPEYPIANPRSSSSYSYNFSTSDLAGGINDDKVRRQLTLLNLNSGDRNIRYGQLQLSGIEFENAESFSITLQILNGLTPDSSIIKETDPIGVIIGAF